LLLLSLATILYQPTCAPYGLALWMKIVAKLKLSPGLGISMDLCKLINTAVLRRARKIVLGRQYSIHEHVG